MHKCLRLIYNRSGKHLYIVCGFLYGMAEKKGGKKDLKDEVIKHVQDFLKANILGKIKEKVKSKVRKKEKFELEPGMFKLK